MKKEELMTLKSVTHTLDQMKRIDGLPAIKVSDLAKELGVKKVSLMDFIDQNKKNIVLKQIEEKKSKPLAISAVFENIGDNPENKEEYLQKQTEDFKKHLDIELMNNYGQISGYYVTYKPRQRAYVNTQSKVEELISRFAMKPAQYYIGGFGDSSLIKPEAGFQITKEQMETLECEGWTLKIPKP